MPGKSSVVGPVYQQIAVDIAAKVANGKYKVGERISGRSTLSGQYGVSPETIRRAMYLLKDMGIVEITKGSGITILSPESAARFVEQYRDIETIGSIKREIVTHMERQRQENERLYGEIEKLVDLTERFHAMNPFTPFEIRVTADMNYVGKTSAETMFWHKTGATIIAVKRGEETILSPGPYADFMVGDVIYFVGRDDCLERVKAFFITKY